MSALLRIILSPLVYNTRVEIPTRCSCGKESMIDWSGLEVRPASKLISVEGFTCQYCERWEAVFYTTQSLMALLERLEEMKPTHKNFAYYFAKTLKKAEGIQRCKH